jgi:branched-chain amino acid transport system ATP-binding protein
MDGRRRPVLEVDALSSHYGRIQALRSVSVTIAPGEIVALVGANGAGKTTLMRAISGVQPVTAGHIRWLGHDITRVNAHRRVALGISHVPEGRLVFAPLSVEDNLRLGAYVRTDRAVAGDLERVYDLFPILSEFRRRPAGELSGGQQQMLAVGRALMARPKLLLLDEPSLGLAPLLVEQIFEAIVRLQRDGITMFLVEQNAAAALSIADRGYVMETGSIVLSGSGRQLLASERVNQAYLGP